jgi:glycosyltransferase involved in cell wall biosynthesis
VFWMKQIFRRVRPRLALVGFLLLAVALLAYFIGVLSTAVILLITLTPRASQWTENLLWYSGIPALLGLILMVLGLLRVPSRQMRDSPFPALNAVNTDSVTVVLTAFNDELSIGAAVDDFRNHAMVNTVVVVDNNSSDRTANIAAEHGAEVVVEARPGYGWCVYRSLYEGMIRSPDGIVILCEGDCTFRSFDIEKLVAYLPHADVVNGTRTTVQLVSHETQLTPLMHYGNLLAGKLLDLKYPGRATITDLGTTYKAIRGSTLPTLLANVDPNVNLEFNAHLLDRALHNRFSIVEIPITFWPRVGVSKGGNVSNKKALKVGRAMVKGLVFGWQRAQLNVKRPEELALLSPVSMK